MRVRLAGLVLNKVLRFPHFPDVVVIAGYSGIDRVCADTGGCRLGQAADNQRMVVGPGGLQGEALEQRTVQVAQLEQSKITGDFKNRFEQRQ